MASRLGHGWAYVRDLDSSAPETKARKQKDAEVMSGVKAAMSSFGLAACRVVRKGKPS